MICTTKPNIKRGNERKFVEKKTIMTDSEDVTAPKQSWITSPVREINTPEQESDQLEISMISPEKFNHVADIFEIHELVKPYLKRINRCSNEIGTTYGLFIDPHTNTWK